MKIDYLDWSFTVFTEDGPTQVMGRSSVPPKDTKSTKGRKRHEALLGRPVAEDEPPPPTEPSSDDLAL